MDKLKEDKYQTLRRSSRDYGETNDCTVMAIAMTHTLTYAESHKLLATKCRRIAGRGIKLIHWLPTISSITEIKHSKVKLSRQPNGSRYTVKTIGNYLPVGSYLICVNGHVLPMIDGRVYDWTNDTKHVVNEVYRIGDDLLELL